MIIFDLTQRGVFEYEVQTDVPCSVGHVLWVKGSHEDITFGPLAHKLYMHFVI